MKQHWSDTRLSKKEMDFLWTTISEDNKENRSNHLVGNISKSELITDKDNWFYESTLKKLTERMFYRNYTDYYEDYIEKKEPLIPKFELEKMWVNYQKQHEFNPLHHHDGLFSFVIFVKIPTHWKEQHALPFSAHSNEPCASNFQFVWWSGIESERCMIENIRLCSEDEGRMLFFPSFLSHQVYPFYECEEERITISGNVIEIEQLSGDEYEEKKKTISKLEEAVKFMKEDLKWMSKNR
jgi:hypothetical protein